MIFLLISVAITAWFYHLLPEEVGYRFLSDGSAESYTSRSAIVLWALVPQLVLTLMATGAVQGITRLIVRAGQLEGATINPHTTLLFIGNMVSLPQIILCFAMLDIFSYNAYQVHWLPLWVLILIVMGGGALILGVYFLRSLLRVWKSNKE